MATSPAASITPKIANITAFFGFIGISKKAYSIDKAKIRQVDQQMLLSALAAKKRY